METQVICRFHRRFDRGYYLLTLEIGGDHMSVDSAPYAYPQAHAVVDDFGNLRIVRGWL